MYNPTIRQIFHISQQNLSHPQSITYVFAVCVLVSVNLGGILRFRRDSIVFKELLKSFFKCSLYNKYIVFRGANGRRVKNYQ